MGALFGLDFPVFEIGFVFAMLLLIGLVFVIIVLIYLIKEIKQMRSLLTKEEQNIKEFEKDIQTFEKFEGKVNEANDEIKNYIKVQLEKGIKFEDLKKSLIGQGWDEKIVDEVYETLK